MHRLSDLALEAIIKEWHPQEYDPPFTDAQAWVRSIESLCDTYGIPEVQRSQCATRFVKDELRVKLPKAWAGTQAMIVPTHWDQFKNFVVTFDRDFQERWKKLWLYERCPTVTGTALVVAGGVLFTSAVTGALSYVGSTSASGAAESIPETVRFTAGAYDRVSGILSSRVASWFEVFGMTLIELQPVGTFTCLRPTGATTTVPTTLPEPADTTAVLQSICKIVAGAAITGAGAVLATNGGPMASASSELLRRAAYSVFHGGNPTGYNNRVPPHRTAVPEEHLLTPQAVLAIVKSWDVGTYNPPGTNCASWLGKIQALCEQYGIPLTQWAPCAMHHMRADCKEAAYVDGCCNMSWAKFTGWLHQHDREDRNGTNEKIAELSARSLSTCYL